MIRQKLVAIISQAMAQAHASGKMAAISPQFLSQPLSIDRPRLPIHGDLSCNVALQMAAQANCDLTAMQLAQILASTISESSADSGYFTSVQAVAPGFINFALGPRLAAQILFEICRQGDRYGAPEGYPEAYPEIYPKIYPEIYKDGHDDKAAALCDYLPGKPEELSLIETRRAVSLDCLARLSRFAGRTADLSISFSQTLSKDSAGSPAISQSAGLALLKRLGVDISLAAKGRVGRPENDLINLPSAASALTLADLEILEKSIGPGPLRYALLICQPDTWQDVLNKAQETGPSNPALLVQRAYSRCCASLRLATEERVNILSGTMEEPLITLAQWQSLLLDCRSQEDIFIDLFKAEETENYSDCHQTQIDLILKLADFPQAVSTAADLKEPERLAAYVLDLANHLSLFYRQFNLGQGLFSVHLSVLKARLGLIFATKQVFTNALGIIGMSVPERM